MNDRPRDPKILIVDDDRELGGMLREFLAPEHFDLAVCASGEDGLGTLGRQDFDLLILDIMLPGMSGIEVLKQVRQSSEIPIIMLTARGDDVDRILGLEFGADDYLAKPFNPRELLARIRAIMRRSQPAPSRNQRVEVGSLELDVRSRRATAGGKVLRLTGTEFDLLRCLAESRDEVVTRDRLSREALGRPYLPYDRSIDTHISSVRAKLAKAGVATPTIQSRRGVGYCLLAGG